MDGQSSSTRGYIGMRNENVSKELKFTIKEKGLVSEYDEHF